MGKRSTTSTKSGKFMNPTDQARKEARRKELKKNKKQRMAVRHAVLKGKDAQKILYDLDEVDDMEFNPSKAPLLADKVLKEKRKKLIETFERVLRLYEKEEPEMYTEFKELFDEYHERKQRKQNYYEEVKSAERVLIDEIPMPDITVDSEGSLLPTSDIPLPQPKSILKKSAPKPDILGLRKPPGPPAGPPPQLSDSEDENEPEQPVNEKQSRMIRFADDGETKEKTEEISSQPVAKTPLQEAMLKFAADQEAEKSAAERPEDGEEVFAEHGTSETTSQAAEKKDTDDGDADGEKIPDSNPRNLPMSTADAMHGLGQPMLYAGPGGAPVLGLPAPRGLPGALMRPQGIQLPPGPPPGLPPAMRMHRLPPGLPPRLAAPRMAPLGMLPPGMRPPMMSGQANVLSAPASIMKPPVNVQKPKDGRTIISAKPQIKHTIGDVTRFIPAALKVKRNPQAKPSKPVNPSRPSSLGQRQAAASTAQTKDDAYDTFLKEIEGIM